MEADKQTHLTGIFRALRHPVHLAILDVLREGAECVCHLEARLGYRQAHISQHLAVLRDTGLVQNERDGQNIYYRVARPEVFALIDVARAMVGLPMTQTQHASNVQHSHRPCPRCASAKRKM